MRGRKWCSLHPSGEVSCNLHKQSHDCFVSSPVSVASPQEEQTAAKEQLDQVLPLSARVAVAFFAQQRPEIVRLCTLPLTHPSKGEPGKSLRSPKTTSVAQDTAFALWAPSQMRRTLEGLLTQSRIMACPVAQDWQLLSVLGARHCLLWNCCCCFPQQSSVPVFPTILSARVNLFLESGLICVARNHEGGRT